MTDTTTTTATSRALCRFTPVSSPSIRPSVQFEHGGQPRLLELEESELAELDESQLPELDDPP